MEPAVGQSLGFGGMPIPAHELLSRVKAGFEAGNGVRVGLSRGPVEVQLGYLDRILA